MVADRAAGWTQVLDTGEKRGVGGERIGTEIQRHRGTKNKGYEDQGFSGLSGSKGKIEDRIVVFQSYRLAILSVNDIVLIFYDNCQFFMNFLQLVIFIKIFSLETLKP